MPQVLVKSLDKTVSNYLRHPYPLSYTTQRVFLTGDAEGYFTNS